MKSIFQGLLLVLGMFLYSGIAVGALQEWGYAAAIIWIPLLLGSGVFLRRWLWPQPSSAIRIVGGAFLGFSGIMAVICGFNVTEDRVASALWNGSQMTLWFYAPWFWFPFMTGVVVGGIFRNQQAEQGTAGDGDKP